MSPTCPHLLYWLPVCASNLSIPSPRISSASRPEKVSKLKLKCKCKCKSKIRLMFIRKAWLEYKCTRYSLLLLSCIPYLSFFCLLYFISPLSYFSYVFSSLVFLLLLFFLLHVPSPSYLRYLLYFSCFLFRYALTSLTVSTNASSTSLTPLDPSQLLLPLLPIHLIAVKMWRWCGLIWVR